MRDRLESETIKLDSKLIELLSNQMALLNAENLTASPQVISASQPKEIDHSLPLKVGEEINRMRLRLNALPAETKGLKPLMKSLERLEEEFNQQGYELVEMLGKKFDDGLNVQARFIPSDELEKGDCIITKIIRPQINYNGKLIQLAEIEVSTGG